MIISISKILWRCTAEEIRTPSWCRGKIHLYLNSWIIYSFHRIKQLYSVNRTITESYGKVAEWQRYTFQLPFSHFWLTEWQSFLMCLLFCWVIKVYKETVSFGDNIRLNTAFLDMYADERWKSFVLHIRPKNTVWFEKLCVHFLYSY
mgnify:CR=1 FL=1